MRLVLAGEVCGELPGAGWVISCTTTPQLLTSLRSLATTPLDSVHRRHGAPSTPHAARRTRSARGRSGQLFLTTRRTDQDACTCFSDSNFAAAGTYSPGSRHTPSAPSTSCGRKLAL